MKFGWQKKVEFLRVTLLSAGHQVAKELPPGMTRILEIFRQVARTGDGSTLQAEISAIPLDAEKPLWEPIEVHGWSIQGTLYWNNGQLWWLLHAERRDESAPSEKDSKFLDRILDYLGADPKRDMIIGPSSSPAGEPLLPFGWWTWFNQKPLCEIQVKGQGRKAKMRIVPLDTPASDGFVRIDVTDRRERSRDLRRNQDGSE